MGFQSLQYDRHLNDSSLIIISDHQLCASGLVQLRIIVWFKSLGYKNPELLRNTYGSSTNWLNTFSLTIKSPFSDEMISFGIVWFSNIRDVLSHLIRFAGPSLCLSFSCVNQNAAIESAKLLCPCQQKTIQLCWIISKLKYGQFIYCSSWNADSDRRLVLSVSSNWSTFALRI